MILKLPRWWTRNKINVQEEIDKLKGLRDEAEASITRSLKMATLNDDDEYWRHQYDKGIEGLTCGVEDRKENS